MLSDRKAEGPIGIVGHLGEKVEQCRVLCTSEQHITQVRIEAAARCIDVKRCRSENDGIGIDCTELIRWVGKLSKELVRHIPFQFRVQRLTSGIKGGRFVKNSVHLPRDTGHLGGGASSDQSHSERNGEHAEARGRQAAEN